MCENNEIKDSDITFGNAPNERAYLMKEMSLEEYTYHIIRTYLNKYDNNVLEVADKLDIGKSSIYRYLKEMEARGIWSITLWKLFQSHSTNTSKKVGSMKLW